MVSHISDGCSDKEIIMKVGDLVEWTVDGDIGIITEVDCTGMAYILWASDFEGWHLASEMEVINEE